jgi:hypothetical protein
VRDLFRGYNKLIRPVQNMTQKVEVAFGLAFIQLISVVRKLSTYSETVSRDILPCFFIKQLLLVLLDTPRKDFDFFRLFEELFVFVIDFLVYSPPGSRASPVRLPGVFIAGESTYIGLQKNLLMQNTPGSQDSPVINRLGSLVKTPL